MNSPYLGAPMPASGTSVPVSYLPDDSIPTAAGIYDYLAGGVLHSAADRAAAAQLLAVTPRAGLCARANKAFGRRAILRMLDQGIGQFIDLGCGLPNSDTVHDLVLSHDPNGRVVYVDSDLRAVTAMRDLLGDNNDQVGVVHADLCLPGGVLGSATVLELLDLTLPVGLLALGSLQFVPDDYEPYAALTSYRSLLAPGSALAISHLSTAHLRPEQAFAAAAVYSDTFTPLTVRTPARITKLFDGFALEAPDQDGPPGVVPVVQWRPDEAGDPGDTLAVDVYGGVGYLPRPAERTSMNAVELEPVPAA